MVLQFILVSKLSELEQFENFAANNLFRKEKEVKIIPNQTDAIAKLKERCVWLGWCCPGIKIEF